MRVVIGKYYGWCRSPFRDQNEVYRMNVPPDSAGAGAEHETYPHRIESASLLSAGFAHDFNNLLTVINGYGDLLLKSHDLPEKARRCVAAMRSAGERASALAQAMMALSRRPALETRRVDLVESVHEAISLARQLVPSNIELSADLPADLPMVRADHGGILQVLLNLIVNARDAMPEGGKVEIRTSLAKPNSAMAGEFIELAVSDNGEGMDEETRRRVFEPFFTTKAPGAGTGLGLPMVQHIVKQSGGFLSIESDKGKGTTVRIFLQAAEGENLAESPGEGNAGQGPSGGHETILVVEDSGALRHLIRDLLESLGYSVLDAASAAEAVELASGVRDRLDLLIVDVVLPDSSGLELAECLRESRPRLPVLYISGYLEEQAIGEGSQAEGEFLSKPFTMEEFAHRVRRILDRQHRKRILLVDDDEQVLMFAREVLIDAGFEVLVGNDGNEALSIVEKEPLDLVITDLVMREREGLETMMRLRKSNPNLPVIAISGAFGGHFLRSAAMLGARATLPKPFSGEDLVAAVKKVLEG
jgi:two-component system cell cycle sensor histidine kinase/response regulator CckA